MYNLARGTEGISGKSMNQLFIYQPCVYSAATICHYFACSIDVIIPNGARPSGDTNLAVNSFALGSCGTTFKSAP